MKRYIHFANRLTGWNAIKTRVDQLNLNLTDQQCKDVTQKIKKLGDIRQLTVDDVDSIIKDFHAEVSTPQLQPKRDNDDIQDEISEEPATKKSHQ